MPNVFGVTALFLLLMGGISWPLWGGPRAVPEVPLITLPDWGGSAALAGLLVSLALHRIVAWQRLTLAAFTASALLLVCADQLRLQPWFYQYVVMLGVLWRIDQERDHGAVTTVLRVVLGAIYFWSGMQKCHLSFLLDGAAWFAAPAFEYGEWVGTTLYLLFLPAPLIECAIGVGFLFRRTMRMSAYGAIAMHLAILALLGPFGRGTNEVVWPWNVFMILMNIGLLRTITGVGEIGPSFWRLPRAPQLILALFAFLPSLNWVGWWDSYLSFSLYSWNTEDARFIVEKIPPATVIPREIAQHAVELNGKSVLYLRSWSMRELGVPTPPEQRIFKALAKQICSYTGGKGQLEINGRPSVFFGVRSQSFFGCAELQ